MYTYTVADENDRGEIIDFINYVFSQTNVPHNFKTLIPKVYSDVLPELGAEHYLVKEDGRIKAVVAQYFFDISVSGEKLRVGFIGSVSVNLYSRGKGYMKLLMAKAREDAVRRGVDIMALGGQRQRYEYYGFERGGSIMDFSITPANIRHCCAGLDDSIISVVPFDELSGEETDFLRKMYEKRPAHTVRDKNYLLTMKQWNSSSYGIKKGGKIIGYFYNRGQEFVLEDYTDILLILKTMSSKLSGGLSIHAYPYETEKIAALSDICEGVSVYSSEMIHILNFRKVMERYLKLKAQYFTFTDRTYRLKLGDENLKIAVRNNVPEVTESDEEPEAVFSVKEAEMYFFGMKNIYGNRQKYWELCNLPFAIDAPDEF